MRWFHVTEKDISRNIPNQTLHAGNALDVPMSGRGDTANSARATRIASGKGVNFPMSLQVTHRKFRNFNFGTLCTSFLGS